MQKPCKNHVKIMSKSCQNHVMQTCKNHANMQKPCKNHANMQKPCNMRRVRWRLHCEKTCKLFVSCKKQAVPHAMKKPRAKPCEKTCKLFVSCKNKLFHMSCKNHAKTMQTCKNHATCGAYAGVNAGRRGKASTQGRRGKEASMPGKWRAILLQYCGNKSPPWSIFESNRGGSSCRESLHSRYLSLLRGFSKWLIFYLRGF